MHNQLPIQDPDRLPRDLDSISGLVAESPASTTTKFSERFGRTVAVSLLGLSALGVSIGAGTHTAEADGSSNQPNHSVDFGSTLKQAYGGGQPDLTQPPAAPSASANNSPAAPAEAKSGSTVHDKVKAFYLKYNGQDVNEGGAYGYQCTSLTDAYASDMFGVPHSQVTDEKGTHNNTHGDAIDYYTKPDANLLSQFVKMPAGTQIKEGDIVVFGATADNSHGHVAIALGDQQDKTVWIMEQNDGSGNGDGQGANATRARNATLTPDFLGVLRPKQTIAEEQVTVAKPAAPAPTPKPATPTPGPRPTPTSGAGSNDKQSFSSALHGAPELNSGTNPSPSPASQGSSHASPQPSVSPTPSGQSTQHAPSIPDLKNVPGFDVPAANPSAPGIDQDIKAVFGGNEANFAPPTAPPQPQPEQQDVASEFPHFNPANIPPDYVPLIEKAAGKYGIDPSFLATQLKIESDIGQSKLPGVHSGTNSAGAMGPAQFISSTWKAYAVDADGNPNPNASPFDPAAATMTQARYDAAIHAALQAHGLPVTNELTLVWYNGGYGAVQHYIGGAPYDESVGYVTNFNKFLPLYTK